MSFAPEDADGPHDADAEPRDAELIDALVQLAVPRDASVARSVIGIGGSVAVGKSTLASRLAAVLSSAGMLPTVIGTDGFLHTNDVLRERGILSRKGFPESYDVQRLTAFLQLARNGRARAMVPVYSHEVFDVVGERTVELGDVVILEGVNALQPAIAAHLSYRLYIDADERDIVSWFERRFLELINDAETDPASFYRQFVPLDADGRIDVIRQVWDGINGPNLHECILPTKAEADTVVHLDAEHRIVRLEHRRARTNQRKEQP